MRVLEYEHRSADSTRPEPRRERVVEPAAECLRLEVLELVAGLTAEQAREVRDGLRRGITAQQLCVRPVRDSRAIRQTARGEPPDPARRGARAQRFDQVRLAHTGFAGQRHEAAVERRLELREFLVASNERRRAADARFVANPHEAPRRYRLGLALELELADRLEFERILCQAHSRL